MRGKKAPIRQIKVDPRFQRVDLAKLINKIMSNGKKTTAQRIVYKAFDYISDKTKQDPLEIYDAAIRNISPALEVNSCVWPCMIPSFMITLLGKFRLSVVSPKNKEEPVSSR